MFYLLWIPILIIQYFLIGFLSVKNNNYISIKYQIAFTVLQILPFWVIVSRYSKNLTFDAMLYDVILFLTCTFSIGYFSGQLFQFSLVQIIGFVLVIIGFIVMQLGNY